MGIIIWKNEHKQMFGEIKQLWEMKKINNITCKDELL